MAIQRRPNLLFLLCDQLRACSLPLYGGVNIETPHLDALAVQGVTLDRCLSTCPVCTPYRSMLVAGRHPQTTGHLVNSTRTRHDELSIADALNHAGYRTAWVGKWHLHTGAWPANNVPDWVPTGRDRLGFDHWKAYNQHMVFFDGPVHGRDWDNDHWDGYETDGLWSFARCFLDEQLQNNAAPGGQRDPFALFLSVHPPHDSPFEMQRDPQRGMAPGKFYDALPDALTLRGNVPEEQRDDALAQLRHYLAMTLAVDDLIGEVVRFLDARGLANDTLLVFTSDHGTQGGSHGESFWMKQRPYEESMHVPAVLRWPGVLAPGRREGALFSPVDWLPTLCGLCDAPVPDTVEGRDLSAALRGEPGAPSGDALLTMNFTAGYDYFRNGAEWRGVRTATHSYARRLDGTVELFDLDADPLQQRNLAEDASSEALRDELERRLQALLAERGDTFEPCENYRPWHDAQRRVVRNAYGPLPHPESEPDFSKLRG